MKFTTTQLREILNALLETGADYAEIFWQDSRTQKYSRRKRRAKGVLPSEVSGLSLRALRGSSTLFASTTTLSFSHVLSLARKLALGFDGRRERTVDRLERRKVRNPNPVLIPHDRWTDERKLDLLRKAQRAAYAVSPQIENVAVLLEETDDDVTIVNSTGGIYRDRRTRTFFMVSATARKGERLCTGTESRGLSKGLELLEEIDVEDLARKGAAFSLERFDAKKAPSGSYPVVLARGGGGTLFHEACGHPLEGEAVSENASPFAGKIGQLVASPLVTAYDDGTIPSAFGSLGIDDEGNAPTKNLLIKDGVLVNYILDRRTSRKMGEERSTGSCRRESYAYLPTTRMTNTFIANGSSTPEEILRSVKDGIYCVRFSGGQVNTVTSEFTFTSDEAYRIQDGRITDLLEPITLMGYGFAVLKDVAMVGNDLERAPGFCGAGSGTVEVEDGMPTILVSKLLVGGEGEEG